MSDKPPLLKMIVVDLWGQTESECGICEVEGEHRHAVGWYCGPVKEGIGEPVPEWGPDAVAGGRAVCKTCHDRLYGVAPVQAVRSHPTPVCTQEEG